jgi:hypothetical protein
MVKVKDLTEITLKELWQEVTGEDDFWGDLKQEELRALKGFLETTMDREDNSSDGLPNYLKSGQRGTPVSPLVNMG